MPEPEPAAPTARDSGENPIQSELNFKRRLRKKSAASTASGSGQDREKRPVTGTEPRMQIGDMLELGTGEKHNVAQSTFSKQRAKNC